MRAHTLSEYVKLVCITGFLLQVGRKFLITVGVDMKYACDCKYCYEKCVLQCFAGWRLSSSSVVVRNAGSGPAAGHVGTRYGTGRLGTRHGNAAGARGDVDGRRAGHVGGVDGRHSGPVWLRPIRATPC